MVNEKLFEYIKTALHAGQSREIITQILLKHGWKAEDIQEVFDTILHAPIEKVSETIGPAVPKRNSNKLVLAGVFFLVFVSLVAVGGYVWKMGVGDTNTSVTTVLGTISSAAVQPIFVSLDAEHYAYKEKQGNKFSVVYDGKAGKQYDNVFGFDFSPNSTQFVYVAMEGKKVSVVLNNEEGKWYDQVSSIIPLANSTGIEDNVPLFNSDGKLTYEGAIGGTRYLVVDGKEVDNWLSWLGQMPSPDGKGFADKYKSGANLLVNYTTKDGGGNSGRNSNVYLGVDFFKTSWSPNGKHFAYRAYTTDNASSIMVIDGVEGNRYGLIDSDPIWSPDSNNVAYVATRAVYDAAHINDDNQVVVVNGKESNPYYLVFPDPIFSPDGKQVAFGRYKNGTQGGVSVVLNGKEGPTYDHVSDLTFSPDGTQLAYVAESGTNIIVVVNGEEKGRYNNNYSPLFGGGYSSGRPSILFSQDSKHLVFLGYGGGKYFVVLDGKQGKGYDGIYFTPDSFSADGKHFTYVAIQGTNVLHVDQSF